MHKLKFLALIMAFGVIGSASAVEVLSDAKPEPAAKVYYKSYDQNGNLVFSDVADPSVASEVIVVPKTNNIISAPNQGYSYQQQQMFDDNAHYRQLRHERRAANFARKQQILEAKQAMLDAKAPRDDEWQHTNKQRRFLKPSYHERQRQAELQYKQKVREIKQQYR